MVTPTDQIQQPLRDPGDHHTRQPADEHSSDPVKSEPRGDLFARIDINLNDLSRGVGGKFDL
jgi:hypothetical protein